MSRAVICLVVLLVAPALAEQQQVQTTVTRDGQTQTIQTIVTLPDGTQVQGTGSVQIGIVDGLVAAPGGPAPRDTRPTTGNSRIRGRVLVADTGQPARRATVNISAPEVRGNRTATTDLDGRYEFANLPAGRYSISANKSGFISLSYGQARPTTPSQTLTLAEKQSVDNVDLRILRGGAITGRVVDEFGDPVSGVPVMTLRTQFQQGQQRLTTFGPRVMTNDIGEYRIFALPAGSYYIAASPQPPPTPVSVQALFGDAIPGEERSGFATVFYPGTTDSSAAAKVAVAFGQTATEINFALVTTRLSQVSGLAIDSQGRPMAAGTVMTSPRGRGQGIQSPSGQLKPDGTFVIPNMPPGEYMLRAIARQPPPPPPAPGAARPPIPRQEVATAFVTVDGDVSGIRLAPVVPAIVSGRVLFDNAAAAASLKPAAIRMSVQALNPIDGPSGMQGLPPTLKDDFSFEFQVDPGLVMLRPNVPGGVPGLTVGSSQPWGLKALRVNGLDVINSGLELRSGERVDGVEIEMTSRPPELSGNVTAGGSVPPVGFNVIVFSQDRDHWLLPGPGLSAMMRTDQTGHFSTRNLRPGRYYILAVYELEQGTDGDPEFLQSAIPRATAFSIADGETKTIELRGQAR